MKRWVIIGLIAILGVAAAISVWPAMREEQRKKQLAAAELAYAQADYEKAEEICRSLFRSAPEMTQARIVAGQSAMARGAIDQGMDYLKPLLENRSRDAATVIAKGGDFRRSIGDVEGAENIYNKALEVSPQNNYARQQLVELLTMEGRGREALPHRFHLVRAGAAELNDLRFLANPDGLLVGEEFTSLVDMVPNEPKVMLGNARFLMQQDRLDEAKVILEKAVKAQPDLVEATVQLGMLLTARGTTEEIIAWDRSLPAEAESHPDVWIVRGVVFDRQGKHPEAARCFWEALKRDRNHVVAHQRLSEQLNKIDQPDAAQRVKERGDLLDELIATCEQVDGTGDTLTGMEHAAVLSEQLGRLWECWAWRDLILRLDSTNVDTREAEREARSRLADDLPLVLETADPTRWVSFDETSAPRLQADQ